MRLQFFVEKIRAFDEGCFGVAIVGNETKRLPQTPDERWGGFAGRNAAEVTEKSTCPIRLAGDDPTHFGFIPMDIV